jgi:plastocyanin
MRTNCGTLVLAALLGASMAAILPAVAGGDAGPTITAVNGSGLYAEHSWSPSALTVGEGASVAVSNPTTVPHGVRWVSGPATPSCSSGVPVGTSETASGTQWSGSCTFAQAGSYRFYCTVHGAAMSATVTVGTAGSGQPSPPPTTTAPTGQTPPGGTGAGGPSGTTGAGEPAAGLAGSPFAGGTGALKLARTQHSSAVRGSLAVSRAGAGGKLEVELRAKAASLARSGRARTVLVGALERGGLSAGTVRFTVPLRVKARRALKRKGRLALMVEVKLTPAGGRAAKLERAVLLRPAA